MDSNQQTGQSYGDQTPEIHQTLLSSTPSAHQIRQKKAKEQFPFLLKFQQSLSCFVYLSVFINILYIVVEVLCIFGTVRAFQDDAIIPGILIIAFFILPGISLMIILQNFILKRYLFSLLQSAKPKSILPQYLKLLQKANTHIKLSLQTTNYDNDNAQYTYQKQVYIHLKPQDHCNAENKLSDITDQHNFLLIDFQVNFSFNDPQDWVKISKTIEDYKEVNKKNKAQNTIIDTKFQLGFDTTKLASFYYTYQQQPPIKLISFWGCFFAAIGLSAPFIIVAQCIYLKRHKVKIVKNIQSIRIK